MRHVSRPCLLTSCLDTLAGAQTADAASSCIADSDAAVLDLPGLDVASEAFAVEIAEHPSLLSAGSLEELTYMYVSSVAISHYLLSFCYDTNNGMWLTFSSSSIDCGSFPPSPRL